MEKYELYRIISRKSKEGKEYFLAIVILSTDNDCEIVRILLRNHQQAEKLQQAMKTPNFDISKYIEIKYNSYSKSYLPSINYGL